MILIMSDHIPLGINHCCTIQSLNAQLKFSLALPKTKAFSGLINDGREKLNFLTVSVVIFEEDETLALGCSESLFTIFALFSIIAL